MLKSTFITGSMTFLSRISGLVRDKVFSFAFGSEPVMDAFFVAFKIPNLLRRFFAEGAFSQAFVPVLAQAREQGDRLSVKELVGRTSGTLAVVLFGVTLVGVLAAPVLIYVFAPGFDATDVRRPMAVTMLRWTFPYLMFISLAALAGAVLNTYRRFAVPAFTPLLLNLVLISFAGWIAPESADPGRTLAIGVFVAGLAQLGFQLPFVARLGVLGRPRWAWRDSSVRRILTLMLPIMFGSTVAQINILFDTLIATLLAAGSVSWLYYSDRLVEFPLGVFGIALATVILPALSRHHARASEQEFSRTLDWALHLVVLIALPAAVGLFMLAGPMIATIFYGGAFTAEDVDMAAWSLMAFAPGLVAFVLVKVLSPGFFARQDTRTPVRIAVKALGLGMLLNVVLVYAAIQTSWAPPHAGLAAATSLSAMFNAGALLRGLLRLRVYVPAAGWSRFLVQVCVSCGAMALAIHLLLQRFGDWIALGVAGRITALTVCVVVPMAVFLMACLVVGDPAVAVARTRTADSTIMLGLACQIPAMHLYRSVNTIPADSKSRVVAIGVFDGLHIGHRQLIAEAQTLARSRGARATVLTFEPMPREYLSPENPPARLTSFRERCELIRDMGVDELCCLRFGSVQRLESEEFIDSLLVGRLMASAVIVGDDFRFGAGRQGTVEDLIEASRLRDFDVRQIPPVVCQGTRVSSTGVRQALADGDLAAARLMLGRDYSMSGKVARGLSLGRELGFPTANISMGRRVPAVSGVFAVRVAGIGEALLDAVASLGTRPTIGGDSPLLEVHLFDFDKDIYGRRIEVRFISKLRSEEKFSDLEAMRKQMKVDADQARAALSASIA